MKILILSDEVWNDHQHGNNVLTNWFEGMNADFASIYCSPGSPSNNVCKKYFQITDTMMFRSFFFGGRAGRRLEFNRFYQTNDSNSAEMQNIRLYRVLKSINFEFMRTIREIIWSLGRYNKNEIDRFIKEFKPDIVFCARKASHKILRLERLVKTCTNAPLIVFTGDDEYSLKQLRFSPLYWLTRISLRNYLAKNMSLYDLYYTHSSEQGLEYYTKFGVNQKRLYKGTQVSPELLDKNLSNPIILIYAGKLYCNRWKVLVQLAKSIRRFNEKEKIFELRIYTKDKLSHKQMKLLDDGHSSYVLGAVSSEELNSIYKEGDIALHVESFDMKNRYLTQYSFSTKIIDCLGSSCAVMAICWEEHTGYRYLKEQDAAICISSYKALDEKLVMISEENSIVESYRKKAIQCIKRNHNRKKIQDMIYQDFFNSTEKSEE